MKRLRDKDKPSIAYFKKKKTMVVKIGRRKSAIANPGQFFYTEDNIFL